MYLAKFDEWEQPGSSTALSRGCVAESKRCWSSSASSLSASWRRLRALTHRLAAVQEGQSTLCRQSHVTKARDQRLCNAAVATRAAYEFT